MRNFLQNTSLPQALLIRVITATGKYASLEITALPTSQNWDYLTFAYYLVPSIACHHCRYCTWYDTCLLYTSPSPTTKNHKHTYDSMPRLLCARQSFVLTHTRQQQQQQHHRNHHRHTTPTAQQQHSSSTAAETTAEAVVT